MSMTNGFETSILGLMFTNVDAAFVGDATGLRGSSTAGAFYVSLHTAFPSNDDDQNNFEAAYGSYARVSVARSTAQWTVTDDICDNDNSIVFPTATSGSETETYFVLGSDSSGAGHAFFWGLITGPLLVTTGVPPTCAAGDLDISLD